MVNVKDILRIKKKSLNGFIIMKMVILLGLQLDFMRMGIFGIQEKLQLQKMVQEAGMEKEKLIMILERQRLNKIGEMEYKQEFLRAIIKMVILNGFIILIIMVNVINQRKLLDFMKMGIYGMKDLL